MRHDSGRDAAEQQRLVTDFKGTLMLNLDRTRDPPAIAARQKERVMARFQQELRERDGGWGLAGAAQREIADANDRHWRLAARPDHAPRRDCAVEGSHGRKQGSGRAAISPPKGWVTH